MLQQTPFFDNIDPMREFLSCKLQSFLNRYTNWPCIKHAQSKYLYLSQAINYQIIINNQSLSRQELAGRFLKKKPVFYLNEECFVNVIIMQFSMLSFNNICCPSSALHSLINLLTGQDKIRLLSNWVLIVQLNLFSTVWLDN